MGDINTKIKHSNPGDSNNFDSYMDEIPVKNSNGSFNVVAVATRGFDAGNTPQPFSHAVAGQARGETQDADKTRIEEAKKLRNKEIEKLDENGIKNPALSRGRQELRIKNWDGELRSMEDDLRSEDSGSAGKTPPQPSPQRGGSGNISPFRKGGDTEGIKIREIEREKGNMGVNLDDLASKKNEVERDVEEKVNRILEEIGKFKTPPPPPSYDGTGAFEKGGGASVNSRFENGAGSSSVSSPFLKGDTGGFNRFKNFLRTRIKGARNNIQLWQMLIKKVEEGGIGMSEKEADVIIKLVSNILDNSAGLTYSRGFDAGNTPLPPAGGPLKRGTGNNTPQPLSHAVAGQARGETQGADKTRIEEAKKLRNKEIEKLDENGIKNPALSRGRQELRIKNWENEEKQKLEIGKFKTPQPPPSSDGTGAFEKGGEGIEGKEEEEGKEGREGEEVQDDKEGEDIRQRTEGNNKNNFYSANRGFLGQSGKAKIEDIKYRPKLVGPVEEIKALRINDFRNLADDPNRAAETMKSRIDGLEEDSFLKKMEGISAWRESEVYKMYLEIGRRAMAENKSIKKVCDELRANGGNYLKEEEFYAIMDLNRKLRF